MKRTFRFASVLFLLSLLPLAAGCATGGANGGGERNTTLIVENDVVPPTSLSVYAISELGTRSMVGIVNPGATAQLRFRASAGAREYRFVAETTAGQDITSNPVTVSPGATVRWGVSANIARVTESGGM